MLIWSSEGDGDQRSGDPLPGILDADLVQALACQPPFCFFLIRQSLSALGWANRARARAAGRRGRRTIRRPRGGVHTRVIPVEKPLLGHHLRPFQLQILYSMRSTNRPGVNTRSSATAAATETMKSAMRTVSLRMRWHAQWRAPWRIVAKNSSSGPRRQLPRFFFYFCKAFAGLGEIGDAVSHPFYT